MRRPVVAAVTALALYSAWHSGGHVWRRLAADHRTYAAYSDLQRRREPLDRLPLPGDVFDFYRSHLRRGDRVYFNVMPSGFGPYFDLPGIVAAAGRFYFLPAVQAPDLRRATVVVSYFADPASLKIHFPTQVQAGQQPFYVSRIRTP
jgi:hypothetical protein